MDKKTLQLLRNDFPTYCKVNIKIIDKDGNLVPLILNRMQRMLWKLILVLIAAGKPIRIYLIKARQLGSTTFFCALLYWLITLNANKRVLGIAQSDDAAENLNKRWQDYYINSQPELRPKNRRMNSGEILFATPLKDLRSGATNDPGLNSLLEVQTAKDLNLGRSWTYNGGLITEICQLPGLGIDVKKMMIGLRQAIPRRRNTAVFLESTARGENYTKKMWDNPKNGYEKVFVSYCADDEYRHDLDWSLEFFKLSDFEDDPSGYGDEVKERLKIVKELRFWYPQEDFKQCLKTGNLTEFPQLNEMVGRVSKSYEAWLYHESYCRLSWRRMMIDEECEGDKDAFRQEYPTTVQDAFGVSSKSVFGAIKLLAAKEAISTARIAPYRFSYNHPVDVKTATIRDILQPFSKGAIRIYEPPQVGAVYVAGADCSHGNPDSDDSAFCILKFDTSLNKLVEVASFNARIEATEFAGLLYVICNWYNHALLGVERNNVGIAVLENLRKTLRYSKLYYHYNKDPLDKRSTSSIKYGIDVEGPNRQIMVRDGITWFKTGYILIRSLEMLEQMDTFVENENTGKIAASQGNLDDLVMCKLIAEQMSKEIHIHTDTPKPEPPAYMSLGWYAKITDKQRGVKYDYTRRKSGMRKPIRRA